MTRPEDIPEWAWNAAHEHFAEHENPYADIARAVMAERDRDVEIAEANAHADCPVAEQIAAAIRGGQ